MNDMTIMFFDGYCGLCNSVVDKFMVLDREGKLRYSPLQGETAASHLSPEDISDLSSVVVVKDGKLFRKSDAVVVALETIGKTGMAMALRSVPRPIRDFGYGLVASIRYRIFGKRDSCRLPTPEERSRFLP